MQRESVVAVVASLTRELKAATLVQRAGRSVRGLHQERDAATIELCGPFFGELHEPSAKLLSPN